MFVRSKFTRQLGAGVLLGAFSLGVIMLIRFLAALDLDKADKVASIGAFLVALVVVVPQLRWVVSWIRYVTPLSSDGLAQAQNDLATALERQTPQEERLRRINDPYLLPLRWKVTPRNGLPAGGPPGTSELDGILTFYASLATRRLVILGPAGAGKSVFAMRLVRRLLETRQPGDRVPVIVPVHTWRPGIDLGEWIAEQLVRDLPELGAQVKALTGEVMTSARALVDHNKILPVLDGLDQAPESVRVGVVSQVHAYGSDEPLVLTSRPREYRNAAIESGRSVSNATHLKLLPLQVAEVEAYLTEVEAADDVAVRWRPVFEALKANPKCPLSQVLTNPLMLWLARSVYELRRNDPGELVDAAQPLGRTAIEDHLVQAFVPSVYARRHSRRHSFRCRPDQAQRWLSFLASHIDRIDTHNLSWWRLASAWRVLAPIGVGIRMALRWSAVWVAAAAVVWWQARPSFDPSYAPVHLSDLFLNGPFGQLLRPHLDPVFAEVPWAGFDAGFLFNGNTFTTAVAYAALAGIASSVVAIFFPKESQPRALQLRRPGIIRTAITCVAMFTLIHAAVVGISTNPGDGADAAYILRSWLLLLIAGMVVVTSVPSWVSVPADMSRAVSPIDVLRQDLRTDVVVTVTKRALIAAIVWLNAGTLVTLGYSAYAVGATLISLVLGGVGSPAYRSYADARFRLALSGQLPWRSMRFLADAHQRGVLRQVGAVYQFRRIRLQEQLAAEPQPLLTTRLNEWLAGLAERMEHHRRIPAAPETDIVQRRAWGTLRYWDQNLAERLREGDARANQTRAEIPPDQLGSPLAPRRTTRPSRTPWRPQPDWPFQWEVSRQKGEIIRDALRFHPAPLCMKATVALTAIGTLIPVCILTHPYSTPALLFPFGLSLHVATTWLAQSAQSARDWRVERIVVTNHRLMIATRKESREFTILPLEHIADIRYQQSLVGRMLDYGTLNVRVTDNNAITTITKASLLGRYGTAMIGDVTKIGAVKFVRRPATVYALIVAEIDPSSRQNARSGQNARIAATSPDVPHTR